MTKKKLALLQITRDQIHELDKQIFMLELDRKILIKDYFEMSMTDDVPEPVVKEEPEVTPMTDEVKKEVISDAVLLMK